MNLKTYLPLCFAMAAHLGGCGTNQQGSTGASGLPGPEGPVGPNGQPGPVDPKLTSLFPSGAFLSRTVELQISGSGTHFTAASTVDFADPQITVSQITAGSDNNLRFKVQVGATARLGAHDVTVTTAAETAIIKSAFTVRVALQAEPVGQQPMIAQGGLYPFNLRNLDYHENPFGVEAPTISGFSAVSQSAVGARIDGVALIDARTPAGALTLTATAKSPFDADVLYTTATTDSSLAQVTARTPTSLTNNTARTGETLATPYATNLYKLTTAVANQILILTYSGLGTALNAGTIRLVTAVAPTSGRFSQGFRTPWTYDSTAQTGILITELKAADDYYLSTYSSDYSGAATGYTYTITPKVNTLTAMNNSEPTGETAANPSLLISSLSGAVSAVNGKIIGTDIDYVVFTAASTGNVLLQLANDYVPNGNPYPISVQLYSDAACTTMMGSSQYAGPLSSLTLQIAATMGTTYCAAFTNPFPTSDELPYRLLLVP